MLPAWGKATIESNTGSTASRLFSTAYYQDQLVCHGTAESKKGSDQRHPLAVQLFEGRVP